MKSILDAGPLIGLLNDQDQFHDWALRLLDQIGPPFYSCAEVIAEAAAMTGKAEELVEMIRAGEIILDFDLRSQADSVLKLLKKYRDRKMDLADACIVRMSELTRDCQVITADRADFEVYRRNGRDLIPLLVPPSRK